MDGLREKTISALQGEIYYAAYMGNSFKDCVPVRLLQDALALLKAQETEEVLRDGGRSACPPAQNDTQARLLTLEEVETAENCMEPVFVEMLDEKGKPGETPDIFSWRFVRHIIPATDGKIYMLMNYGFNSALWTETYGTTWRCWTSRPTDEQREAVKWLRRKLAPVGCERIEGRTSFT